MYKYNNTYRYDTYKNVKFDEDLSGGHKVSMRSSISNAHLFQDIDISDFKVSNPHAENFISKLWQSQGGRISNILKLSKNRRLNAEVFNYNNVFMTSKGITAKLQKKMWYGGWAKVKNINEDELRVGFKDVLIENKLDFKLKQPYPINIKEKSTEEIFNEARFIVYGANSTSYSIPRSTVIHERLPFEGIDKISFYPILFLGSSTNKIYEFHPGFWGKNRTDNPEILFRFDQSINEFMLSLKNLDPYTMNPNGNNKDLIEFIRHHMNIESTSGSFRKMHSGTFFAAIKYEGTWKGLIMNW